jgi:hypothetical protein
MSLNNADDIGFARGVVYFICFFLVMGLVGLVISWVGKWLDLDTYYLYFFFLPGIFIGIIIYSWLLWFLEMIVHYYKIKGDI